MNKVSIFSGLFLIGISNSYTIFADSISGQLNVKIVITGACTINDGGNVAAANDFGLLDFGTHADLTSVIDAQALGGAGGAIGITCSPSLTYTVELDNGTHASGNTRRMQNQTASLTTNFIEYGLYQDAARNTAWVAGTPVSLVGTGANQLIDVYGRVPTATIPPAGTYTDAVTVTIAW